MSSKKTQAKQTTKKSNTQKRKARRNANRQLRRQNLPQVNPRLHVAACTREYMKAIVNPFAVEGLPCIPDIITLPSFKICVKARGVLSTSATTGVGFILVDPFQLLASDAGSGGGAINGSKFTQSTYLDSAMNWVDVDPITGLSTIQSDSLFTVADLSQATRQFRLVGCGVGIKYVGTTFHNSGSITAFRVMGNSSIPNNTTLVQLLQDKYSIQHPVRRSSTYIYYVPDDPNYIAYNPFFDFYADSNTLEANHNSMGFFISGGAIDNPQSWNFEIVAYFELIGRGMTLSRSHADPSGMANVLSALPNKAPLSSPAMEEKKVLSEFVKGAANVTHLIGDAYGYAQTGIRLGSSLYKAAMDYADAID